MFLRSLPLFFLLAAGASAQTLTLVSGNGQIVNYFSGQNSKPIIFQLTSGGVAIPNTTITFANSDGSTANSLTTTSAVTDGNGMATVFFHCPFMTTTEAQYKLVAKYKGVTSSVFYESALQVPPGSASLLSPTTDKLNPLKGLAGSPSQAIKIVISAGFGSGLANVAVRISANQSPAPAGVITQHAVCMEGQNNPQGNVFTDATSTATCTPIFSYPNAALNSAFDSFSFDIIVGDEFVFGPFSYLISPMPLVISGPQGNVLLTGKASNLAVTATGGVAPYTFQLTNTSGLLPAGLTLQSNGQITGSSSAPGIYPFTAEVIDATGATLIAKSSYSIAISGGQFALAPTTLGDPVVGIPYTQTVTVTGGVPPFTLGINGTLPPGLITTASSDSITISGTATVASNANVAIKVLDAVGDAGILPLLAFQSINPITLQTKPQLAKAGATYTLTLTPSGGLPPYSFTAVGLPAGLSVNTSAGVISGTPTSAGANQVTATVVDSLGETAQSIFFIDVSGGNIAVSGSGTLPGAKAGAAYSAQVNITGGVPPYAYAFTAQAPGQDLQISAAGVLTGTFSLSGMQTVGLMITDQVNTSQFVSVTVAVAPVLLATTNSATFQTGGIAPGEIISIFGSGLGPNPGVGLQLLSDGFISADVSGTEVLIGGTPAPIFYAGSTQLNVIVPYEVTPGQSTSITVTSNGQTSAAIQADVEIASPGIFIIGTGAGNNQAAVLNQDLSVNGINNPAKVGDVIVVYATGGGQLSSAIADGQLPSALITITGAGLTIGGQTAKLEFAGLAPGYAGLLQFNAKIPSTVTPGDAVQLVLSIGGADSSKQTATVAITQ